MRRKFIIFINYILNNMPHCSSEHDEQIESMGGGAAAMRRDERGEEKAQEVFATEQNTQNTQQRKRAEREREREREREWERDREGLSRRSHSWSHGDTPELRGDKMASVITINEILNGLDDQSPLKKK